MSDINISIVKIKGGAILMVNPPFTGEKLIPLKLINKIAKKDTSSFLFPALYGNFNCEEGEIISDEVYKSYETLRKTYNHENIFVFEALENTNKAFTNYSMDSLIAFVEAIISIQDKVKELELSAAFESFLQSPFYSDFILEYSFTASELIILKGLLKYAFLSDIKPEKLITELKENLETKQNKKLIRKEFINALRQRLS